MPTRAGWPRTRIDGIRTEVSWLLSREVVIGLAVLGGLLALAASLLHTHLGERRAMFVSRAGYVLTAASIVIFIVIGFRGASY